MDIDFIKWMCEKAESVSIDNDTGLYLFGNPVCICDFQSNPLFKKILLQEAIEGVNREYRKYDIQYISNGIVIYDDETGNKLADYWRTVDIDQAKESALKYIFDKEREG